MFGNVSLSYVLDLWLETEGKPRLQGQATLIRSGHDFIMGFAREDAVHCVVAVLDTRMERTCMKLSPAWTRQSGGQQVKNRRCPMKRH